MVRLSRPRHRLHAATAGAAPAVSPARQPCRPGSGGPRRPGARRRPVLRGRPDGHWPVTDHTTVAPLPDDTPVDELELRSAVRNALRRGGVPMLGELRTMSDRELLALRNFGRAALADVRFLVPAPKGGRHEGR